MRTIALLPALTLLAACTAEPPPPPAAPAPPPARPPAAPAPAPVTVKRVFTELGRPSGTDVATTAADGAVTVTFDVLENGRGPHVDATLKLAADGTIDALDARGHHTFGAAIAETFRKEGGAAVWKSHEESGSGPASAHAFFVPMAPIPDAIGLLAAALLKAGGPLPLLPAGEASLEKIGDGHA